MKKQELIDLLEAIYLNTDYVLNATPEYISGKEEFEKTEHIEFLEKLNASLNEEVTKMIKLQKESKNE